MNDSLNLIYYKMAAPEALMAAPAFQYRIMTMSSREEIGVFMFDGEEDTQLPHEEYTMLKEWIHEASLQFYNSHIDENIYDQLNLIWVLMVNEFTDKWSPYRVPFDIRDEYDLRNEELGQQAQQARFWPEKVEVEPGVDFDVRLIDLICFEASITLNE
jgi:YesN/AraC family two-component response regulator